MTIALAPDLDRDTPTQVLHALAAERETRRASEIREMLLALDWADMHSTDSLDHAMTMPGTDDALTIAGQGAPLVTDFAVAELATALGRTADSTRIWLGTVIEARYRLPRLWARLVDGPLEPYKVRRIAEATLLLDPAAAAWVDVHVAPVAHKIGPVKLDQLITEAIRRFDPAQAAADELAAAQHRKVDIYQREVTRGGLINLAATLDAVDARDLEAAIARAAHDLFLHGNTESLDVRRALALGEIARRELAHNETTSAGSTATLYVHLAAGDAGDGVDLTSDAIARIEKGATGYLLGLDRLQDWLTRPGTNVSIRPVIDLNEDITCTGYQPSPRLREQVILRNPTCVFPHCGRPARTADLDHIAPWDRGGPTTSKNIAPDCRLHHRLKTHGGWTYTQPHPGVFIWRSPYDTYFRVDPTGTTPLEPE